MRAERRVYWVSTPRFTVLVEVDTAGKIGRTAPLLWRQWHGQPWSALQTSLAQQWGDAVQVEELGTLTTEEAPP